MRIFVIAKPGSRAEKVEKIDDTHFVVRVKAKPEKGKANEAVLKALAKHFGVSLSRAAIISGSSARLKTVEIML